MNLPRRFARIAPAGLLWAAAALAQPVDFARDIQPLLQQHCYECHGPDKQKNGYRLDRRSSALAGLVRHNIVPGSSASSRMYNRVVDAQFGVQMPPDEPLAAGDVELIRRWIDEGAVWPDALANEGTRPALDLAAVQFVARLRAEAHHPDGLRALLVELTRQPAVVNQRGPGGATPLMFASLYGDAKLLRSLLALGGDARRKDDSGATALHWAIDDPDKVRLLLDHGAPINTPSGIGQTPLTLAAAVPDNTAVVAILLEHGAAPTQAALTAAARGNPEVVQLLLAAGAKDKGDAAHMALRTDCSPCLALLNAEHSASIPKALIDVLPMFGAGESHAITYALAHGADVRATDAKSRSPLILAAISESVSPQSLQEMIDVGADLQARSRDGLNALDYARRVGRQPIIETLTRAGLSATPIAEPELARVTGNTPSAAVARSLPLLQQSGATFYARGGCVSCHHNLMTAVTVDIARQRGFHVNESLAREEFATIAGDIETTREQVLQGVFAPGGQATSTGNLLIALAVGKQPASLSTDALVRLIRQNQRRDGHWTSFLRPPLEASEFTATAVSVRGIRLYGDARDPANASAIVTARRWLEATIPRNTEDQTFKLLGLIWADAATMTKRAAIDELLKTQRPDGGWAQLPWGSSDAYATGEVLVALHTAGIPVSSAAYRRGVQWLLDTQLTDGSWLVKTRAHAGQSYFESGFPHGKNQFISAAATNWATQALALTARRATR